MFAGSDFSGLPAGVSCLAVEAVKQKSEAFDIRRSSL